MTEKYIQKALFENFSSHKYRFTNTYFFKNESDFISFLASGFCYEIEIKISRSDFKADFKKLKHNIHQANEIGKKYYLEKTGSVSVNSNPSWELCREYPELIDARERSYGRNGNPEISLYFQVSSGIEIKEFKNTLLPNKFFYAVPDGLITINDLPEYAGLLYISEDGRVNKVRDAKFIHKDKLSPATLFNKMYYAYENSLRAKFYNR